MEEHRKDNEKKSQALVEVIDFGPLKITGNFLLKDLQRNKEETPGKSGSADAENQGTNHIAMNRIRNSYLFLSGI